MAVARNTSMNAQVVFGEMHQRYINKLTTAYSIGVVLCLTTKVRGAQRVFIGMDSQHVGFLQSLLVELVDKSPWPPPVTVIQLRSMHWQSFSWQTVKLCFCFPASAFDELSFPWSLLFSLMCWSTDAVVVVTVLTRDLSGTSRRMQFEMQVDGITWKNRILSQIIAALYVHLQTVGGHFITFPDIASLVALQSYSFKCCWMQWEIPWPLDTLVCWFGLGILVTINLHILLQCYTSEAPLVIFSAELLEIPTCSDFYNGWHFASSGKGTLGKDTMILLPKVIQQYCSFWLSCSSDGHDDPVSPQCMHYMILLEVQFVGIMKLDYHQLSVLVLPEVFELQQLSYVMVTKALLLLPLVMQQEEFQGSHDECSFTEPVGLPLSHLLWLLKASPLFRCIPAALVLAKCLSVWSTSGQQIMVSNYWMQKLRIMQFYPEAVEDP